MQRHYEILDLVAKRSAPDLLDLPNEILVLISSFLHVKDLYSFSKTNKHLYYMLWNKLDTKQIFEKTFCITYLNYYCSLILLKNWINFPFVFYLINGNRKDLISIAFSYQNYNLLIRLSKSHCMNKKSFDDVQMLQLFALRKIGFELIDQDSDCLYFQNKIANFMDTTITIEMIHFHIMNMIDNLDCFYYIIPLYQEYFAHRQWSDIVRLKINQFVDEKNEKLFIDDAQDLQEFYYGYDDSHELKKIKINKEYYEILCINIKMHKSLFRDLHSCLKHLKNDETGITKIVKYISQMI